MALTAVVPSRNTLNAAGFSSVSLQIPRRLATIAIDTNDAKGAAVTQLGDQGPAAICSFVGDADWYIADTDSLAVGAMRLVKAGVALPFQCSPNLTQNFYMKTATTANISVNMEA